MEFNSRRVPTIILTSEGVGITGPDVSINAKSPGFLIDVSTAIVVLVINP